MTKLKNPKQSTGSIYYLLNHGIYKESSQTIKLRTVFDASAKTSNNLWLNDVLLVGPCIQDDLISIILWFQITADIGKTYRQIEVNAFQR